ncbi:outer membrane protein assembly factor BamD [Marinilabiliaceae bacterium JC017]|nr:outer membrane protein assembly factor BamD [Marinilabiliaceae bacterium JC017]
MKKRVFFALLIFQVFSLSVMAQKSLGHDTNYGLYEKGMELYRQKKYGSARVVFEECIVLFKESGSTLTSEAAYYNALCATHLDNDDAVVMWETFPEIYPESKRVHYAYYQLGDYYQQKKKYRQATRWFDKIRPSSLDKNTRADFYFKAGYAWFMEKDYNKALAKFNAIRGQENKYHTSVKYYYSHIQYEKGNYQTALDGFKELVDEKAFKKVVPFYIAQIYYLKEDYDAAIEYALPMTEEGSSERQADMSRIVADSYFAKQEYEASIGYYQRILELAKEPRREDYYHLGFACYFIKAYDQATEYLAQVTSAQDQMSQNAYYHLADCYLKLDDKKRARVAFEAASKYEFDKHIQEDALFNYIKLNYELSFSPFNEIINSFLTYIELFPESDKIDQAYDYLGMAFLTTKNYREALASMEKISNKSPEVYKALQRVAFYRGLELFTDLKFSEAIEFFDYSLKYAEYDKSLKVQAFYWKGEACYRIGNYEQAISNYKSFIHTPGSYRLEEFKIAHYNMAYAFFKQKDYAQAQSWFRKYVNLENSNNEALQGDAYNRLGDCYYVERDFTTAISYYDKAVGIPEASPDYAMFQKAFCMGLQRKYQEKINMLNTMINRYPKSSFVDDALYEMGRSYVAMDDLKQAIYHYKTIKEKYPKGSYAKKAMLQLGLVYYNHNEYDNSLAFYKRVINEFPGTPEAEDALIGVRNVYMDRNDLDGYVRYTQGLGSFAQVDKREQDSLTFVTAERFYMKGDCEHAVNHFNGYLTAFPDGRFVISAHFYKADCQYRSGAYKEALSAYEYVANRERSLFTEEALIRVGEINYRFEKYDEALNSFVRLEEVAELAENQLEAKIGQMRCLARLEKYQESIDAVEKVLMTPKVSPEIVREGKYIKAKALIMLNNIEEATIALKELAKNTSSVEGAEAKYLVAQLAYDNGAAEEAEKEIFDYIDKGTPHQYWLARAFVLLSDIYHSRGENFQAIQYLESIKTNYKGDDDIMEMVDRRLSAWQTEARKEQEALSVNEEQML